MSNKRGYWTLDNKAMKHQANTQLALIKTGRRVAKQLTQPVQDSTREYVEAAVPDNTLVAYGRQWRLFTQHCAQIGKPALPAEPETVVVYIQHLANAGLRVSSIEQALAAITWMHSNAKHDNPRSDPRVKLVMKGIRTKIGARPKQKTPLLRDQLIEALAGEGADLRGLRNRALVLTGWTACLRASELIGIDCEHVTLIGNTGTILIPKSKTDQEGEGMLKHLPAIDDPRLSAVSALRQWMAAAEITEGPVFRAVLGDEDTRDAYLTTRTARRIIKTAGKRAGLDAAGLSGHSLRSGFITQAALNGVPLWQIAEQSGHKPGSAVLQDYIRTSGAGARSAVLGAFGRKATEA